MAQTKKKTAVHAGKRPAKKSGLSWQVKQDANRGRLIAVIAAVGLVAVIAGFFLQRSGVFSLHTDEEAIAGSTVRINEIVAQNMTTLVTENGDVPDWVEITNTGSEAVNLHRYGLLLESNINNMYSFPDYTLEAGECLVVCCMGASGRGDFSAPFKIEASGGDRLILLNASGKAVDAVELCELGDDEAYARRSDGSWSVGEATPGKDNASKAVSVQAGVAITPDTVALSEVCSANTLYFADENGECHDYVELCNTGSRDVNLAGWYLSDSSDKLKRWSFPDVTLPAGGVLAVHCSGYNRSADANHLHTDFKISGDGESIYLTRPDGQTVSAVDVPALASGQAYSLADGVWTVDIAPTPGAANHIESAMQINALTFGDQSAALRINEIMASATEQEHDWVEIYNGTAQAVNLGGCGLSDSPDKPRKWQFPEGTMLQPGQYMMVYLSGTQDASIDGWLNADFALDAAGGYTVTLCDSSGYVLDAAYLPEQHAGISYGRANGQNGYFLFETATPGADNGSGLYRSHAAEAQASVQGGLFTSGEHFLVELNAPAGSRIYYTLDCTDPDEGATPYTGPIEVSDTTILRSRVYRDGSLPSRIDTQSYLYDVDNNGSVYVVSLVSDPDNLFSDERGIMVKGPNAWKEHPYGKTNHGANFWMDWEREAHVELFEADGDVAFSQGCGLKLHGQYSRATNVKAFKVIARKEYGSNRFEYPIFSNRDYGEYQSFLLRASGQDYNMSFMRDSILSRLAKDTSVMYQESEVGVCYLNGEYYSLFNLRERINKFSICQFEGWEGMEDDIDLIKANDIVMQGSNESFEELLKWVKKHDMSTQEAYDYLDAHIDIQNYIEYMAIECFVGNGDTLNVKRYRNAQADGKWKWVLFDLDWGFYVDSNSLSRWLTEGGMGTGKKTDNTLFIACMENPTFARQFIEYLARHMATDYTADAMMELFMERYDVIEPLIPQYQQRWNIDKDNMQEHLLKLFEYIEERPAKMLAYIQKAMRFSDSQMEQYFADAIQVIREQKAG